MTFQVLSAILAVMLGLGVTVCGIIAEVSRRRSLAVTSAMLLVVLIGLVVVRFVVLG